MIKAMLRDIRNALKHTRDRAALWRRNGSGRFSVLLNLLFLALAWTLLPLEREPFLGLRQNAAKCYPQVNFGAPKPLDALRIVLQTLWLALAKPEEPGGLGVLASVIAALRAFWAMLERLGGLFGRVMLALLSRFTDLLLPTEEGDPRTLTPGEKGFVWILSGLGLVLGIFCITQPFNVEGQVIFLTLMFLSMLALSRIRARITLMLLFVISIVVTGRYLWWRMTMTLNTGNGIVEAVLSLLLMGAELYAFLVMVLGYFQVCWVLDRKPVPMPEERASWPTVDIFIPTYNESVEVVKPTLFAALNLDWPEEKLRVYLLDDGSRPVFERLAHDVGAGYIRRDEHKHAKAGNINHALTVTSGEFIVIFDCDHVPSCDFLRETVGCLVHDPRVALVQTPHHFYSPDPFEKNMHLDRALPIENSLFHDFIQKGNDTWNATMFCGSSAVMRRSALEEVGGIAIETVTEDAHTSLKLNRRGWSSAFISKPLASGLSTESLSSHIGQRIRWARGMIQIFRLDNPLLGRGLTIAQRLCFFNAMVHFLHGLPRLIFLVAPLPYMFANVYVIYATAAAIFAYMVPHMIHSAVTNQMLQHGSRYPFLSSVYETVLAWYILIPTTVALIFPHKGKFNVTAKGMTIDKKYLDWEISRPYLVLIAMNVAGLLIGLWKAVFDPSPEYLTLTINVGWIAYNLMILGAAMSVAVEEVQKHALPRIALRVPVELLDKEGRSVPARLLEYAQNALRVEAEGEAAGWLAGLSEGTELRVRFSEKGLVRTFRALAGPAEKGSSRDLGLVFSTLAEERDFNRFTFAREGMWAMRPEGKVDDRFLTGFTKLAELSLYGYRSMIEFLPGRLLPRIRDWTASFIPRSPVP